MKNIFFMIGSPRKNGNTSLMADMLIQKLDAEMFSIEKLHLYDFEIKPCVDCRACKKGDQTCVINDGMSELYEKIDYAELLIIGTPIYWYGPTAKTKLMLDRLRPYYANKKLTCKKGALLLPAGSGSGDCDLTIEMFKRSFDALGMQMIGSVTAEAYDAGEVEHDANIEPQIAILETEIFKYL